MTAKEYLYDKRIQNTGVFERDKRNSIIPSKQYLISELLEDFAKLKTTELLEVCEASVTGLEWRMEDEPETLDKSDYEHYDNLKQAIENAKQSEL